MSDEEPLRMDFHVQLAANGDVIRVTLKQGEVELRLTVEQVHALQRELQRRFP